MSRGPIARAARRHPSARRRAARYGGLAGRRPTSLPPHLLPGITRRAKGGGARVYWLLAVLQVVLLAAFVGVVALGVSTAAGVGGTVAAYKEVNDDLPNAGLIVADTLQSTRILDRDGNLLQEVAVDTLDGGWRTFVTLDQVSPFLIDATVASEDATFWTHQGVEPVAIARGLMINLTGSGSSGASTITMQLVRSVFDEIGNEYSFRRKGEEALAAVAVERDYTKRDILTMYLNQIFYGQRSYGIEAAARTYFDKHAADMTLAEASLLAGLPQKPSGYNPIVYFDAAKARQEYVLDQMVKHGYITRAEAAAAFLEPLQPRIRDDRSTAVQDSPHFVTYARDYVTARFGDDALYRGGLTITTSIDPTLQDRAEAIVAEQVASLGPYNASNGAAVVMAPGSGEVLAMVGSANFDNALIQGAVNVATSPQQPGSAIKPLVYAAAFEAGWHPGTVVLDTTYRRATPGNIDAFGQPSPFYEPKNYNGLSYGAVPVRMALANSLNIPALKAVEYVGLQQFIDFAHTIGIEGSLDQAGDFYGSAIALGAGEVTPVELTNAYATLANNGKYVPANPILKIEDSQGNVLYELDREAALADAKQAIRAEQAYQVTSILTDNEARATIFTTQNLFGQTQERLRRPTAAKSGTSNEWRDTWTMGYTTDLVVGVWVGNTDNTPLLETDGIQSAGPIWSQLMIEMHENPEFAALIAGPDGRPRSTEFPRPPGIVEGPVCAATGHKPTQNWGNRREILVRGGSPALRCDQLSAYERSELETALRDVRENGGRYAGGGVDSINRYAQAVGYAGTTGEDPYFGYRPPYDDLTPQQEAAPGG